MENLKLDIRYRILKEDELSSEDLILINKAKEATSTSYTPYSHFRVGAAVAMDNGEIICGSNQENAAFPSGLCAERCAIFYAQAAHPDAAVTTLAIAARQRDGLFTPQPISPCGACRQVLAEAEYRAKQPMRVLLYGTRGTCEIQGIGCLLPFMFTDDDMH